ncbi:hypothetical protein J5H42_16325 [Aeromonas dhakensis]|uniref:hypothetical protein n=1 Tax=Aeromonas dhakensis TaxID=196024 RepID=UPI001AAFF4E7|nr:hypothetical protein [Aeromonas dhakensis]MBO2902317.1 hypothetical protein [Aeromonas dhakensis]MBO2995352.1 hypothetical protein [Aeromonas dhakensis]
MKKLTKEQWERDVLRTLKQRFYLKPAKKTFRNNDTLVKHKRDIQWKELNAWIENEKKLGLSVKECKTKRQKKQNMIAIELPQEMDFDGNYDKTVQALTAIRKLVELLDSYKGFKLPVAAYKIGTVIFDKLEKISTSAALVLTAEISKWDSSIVKRLKPQEDGWQENIYDNFFQLGFFELFENKPKKTHTGQSTPSHLNFVKYFRGDCSDSEKARKNKVELRTQISDLVGSKVPKWTILHSGLSEAVTNVTHHAYPDNVETNDKSWYLTGSYNTNTKEMMISFFDQGVGIPNSLPDSKIWEKVLSYFASTGVSIAEQKKHETLLKAAVSLDRTRTGQNDRGKGLQDLLEFIRQRAEGSLSIMSYYGAYQCNVISGKEHVSTASFSRPLCGTLITWCVTLDD